MQAELTRLTHPTQECIIKYIYKFCAVKLPIGLKSKARTSPSRTGHGPGALSHFTLFNGVRARAHGAQACRTDSGDVWNREWPPAASQYAATVISFPVVGYVRP